MLNQKLQVIDKNGERVLLTAQLAEANGTDSKVISKNFTRNQNRYVEGKHYYALAGEEKRSFINHRQIDDSSKNAAVLYLWTEKGAWLHAKSLNTDQAWEAYEMLVDDYYTKAAVLQQWQMPQTYSEALRALAASVEETERLAAEVATKDEKIRIDAPKIRFYDHYMDSDDTMTFTNVGKMLSKTHATSISPQRLKKFLQEQEVLSKNKCDGIYPPRKGYEDYFKTVLYTKSDHRGIVIASTLNLKITPQGVDFIVSLYERTMAVPV